MTPPVADVDALTRCLRDVLGLLALPPIWQGRHVQSILESLLEAIEASIPVNASYVSAPDASGGSVEASRVYRGVPEADWRRVCQALQQTKTSHKTTVPMGVGNLRVVFEPIGYHAAQGFLVVGTWEPAFPTALELVLIRTVTALVATSLETSRALAQREEALKAKDAFLAVLGHELRNPLAPITAALQLMRQRNGGALDHEALVIERQAGHLARLVDDLLDITRITRGGVELQRSRVELATVIERAAESVAGLFAAKAQELQIDVASSDLVVDADPVRLTQVFANLLVNASRYTPSGGHIALAARRSGGRLSVHVRDDGIGIDADLLPRVFDAFVQGRRRLDAHNSGLGIGLSLVRTFTTMHGGTVTAHSEGPGRGTEIVVDLPLAEGAPVPAAEPTATPALVVPTRPRTVLVVDDNEDAADLLAMVLASEGHHAQVLYDPTLVIDTLRAGPVDVVLLDIGMPVLSGYEVAALIQKDIGANAPPLIALTGFGQRPDREKTRAAGFAAHLVKPVEFGDLLARISEVCRADPRGERATVG